MVLCTAGSDCCCCHRCSPSCICCYIWKNHWGKFFLVLRFFCCFVLFISLGIFFEGDGFCFVLFLFCLGGGFLQLEVAILNFLHDQLLTSFHVSL